MTKNAQHGQRNSSIEAPDVESAPVKASLTLLLVDDEDNVLNSLRRIFVNENYTILTANSAAKALEIMGNRQVHLIISDHRMPGIAGAELLKTVREKYPETIRIMLTGFADVNSIMGAVMDGAVYKFITKPWNDEDLRLTVSLAMQQYVLMRENQELKDIVRLQREHFRERFNFHNIVTQSAAMRQALELAARVAASPKTTISLTGESGVGKEVLARAIHFEQQLESFSNTTQDNAKRCWPGRYISSPAACQTVLLRLIAQQYQSRYWKANCLVMFAGPLPAPSGIGRESSAWRVAGQCFWTR